MTEQLKACPFCAAIPKPINLDEIETTCEADCPCADLICKAAAWNRRVVAPEADAWQPIETAPRDGTAVLVTNGVHVALGENLYHESDDMWTFSQTCSECRDTVYPNPTHWQPLPEPPALARTPAQEGE